MTIDRKLIATARSLMLIAALVLAGCSSDGDKERENRLNAAELYQSAKQSMKNGAYERAISNYRLLQSRFPFGRYTEQAHLELGYCYYKNFEPQLAISTMDRFIRTYPTHPNVDYAYYLKGLSNFSRGRGLLRRLLPGDYEDRDQEYSRLAFQDFAELIRRYPDSRYADDARERMVYLRAGMADYEVAVARYYLRRGAYVGAANRAKHVLESYQETPAASEALAVLSEAYEELDLSDLSRDAYRVLQLNAPEHPYITGRYEKENWVEKLWPFD